MMANNKCRVLFFAMLAIPMLVPPEARARVNACRNTLAQHLAPQTNMIARVLTVNNQVPVFAAADTPTRSAVLGFSRNLRAVAMAGSRVQVEESANGSPIGWVEMDDLLCNDKPLMVRGSLERKAHIKPPRAIVGQQNAPGPDFFATPAPGMRCSATTTGCNPIQRFDRRFVYDERTVRGADGHEANWVLLAPEPSLDGTSKLTGWVPKNNIVEWSTYFGLHPETNVSVDSDGHEVSPFFCAFKTLGEAQKKPASDAPPPGCTEISAGPRWEGINEPLPILDPLTDLTPKAVRVATVLNERGEIAAAPASAQPESAKIMDVVFAIDATNSMDHYIKDIAEKFVPEVTTALAQYGTMRFGWVVYRDEKIVNPASMPMQSTGFLRDCNKSNNGDAQALLMTVKASTTDHDVGDDEWEDTGDGLTRAVKMLDSSCRDHEKVLVMVGDAGGRRADRATRVGSAVRAITKLREHSHTYVFFARTPANSAKRDRVDYAAAYDDFATEGSQILAGIEEKNLLKIQQSLPNQARIARRTDTPPEVLSASQPDDVVKEIVANIEAYSNIAPVIDINRQREAGNSLEQAYLNVMRQYPDIPARRFTGSYEADCRSLVDNNPEMAARKATLVKADQSESAAYAKICGESSIIAVEEAYVGLETPLYQRKLDRNHRLSSSAFKSDHKMRIAVRMTQPQLLEWIGHLNNLLSKVKNFKNKKDPLIQARAELVSNIIGGEPKWDPANEHALTYMLRAGGLPVSDTSVLLGYGDYRQKVSGGTKDEIARNQLMDATPDEIGRLLEWLAYSRDLLNIVYTGARPIYNFTYFDDQNEKRIPRAAKAIAENFPPGQSFCMRRKQENEDICWVPKEILP